MNVLDHARGSEEAGTTLAPGSPRDKDKESESWDTNDGRVEPNIQSLVFTWMSKAAGV